MALIFNFGFITQINSKKKVLFSVEIPIFLLLIRYFIINTLKNII